MPANLTEFRGSTGVDVSDRLVSVDETGQIYSYLTQAAQDVYDSTTAGSFWIMGQNYYGQLGLNERTTPGVSSPIQVGSLTDWKQVSLMNYVQGAVKSTGALWMWGVNTFGTLGLGDRLDKSSPVQVGSLTNWKQVSVSDNYACAIKTDGTLWTWGYNDMGQLGHGDRTHRSSPTQVGSLTNWKTVFAQYNSNICAIKTDGALWTWGKNTSGELGLGDQTHRSSPVQVGSLTNWKVAGPGYSSTLAVKTDGTLWAWGNATGGRLGLNSSTTYSSPVQVGALTNWKTVENNPFGTPLALKTDGTLWGWGQNPNGQMGLSISTSSPVQIGSLNTWKQIIGGGYVNGAIK